MAPPYYVVFDLMQRTTIDPGYKYRHYWKPPKAYRGNIIDGQQRLVFACDGEKVNRIAALPTDDNGQPLVPAQTQSIYFNDGWFWLVPYDATVSRVGDGRHLATDGDNDEFNADNENEGSYQDWTRLRFNWEEESDYTSEATIWGEHDQLRVQRVNQGWPKLLLPAQYHTVEVDEDSTYGGLTGELSVLLGLIAFGVPHDKLSQLLPSIFEEGSFSFDEKEWNEISDRNGRTAKRGVVVRVYSWPGFSTNKDLEDWGDGDSGPIFP